MRVTIRGEGTELRGYATMEALASLTSPPGEQPYMVVASPAEDDYDPFKEQEKRELHHFEVEQENARLEADNGRLQRNLEQEQHEHASTLHIGQAYMQERDELREDHTESEKALIDEVNRLTDVLEKIKVARSNHPECEKHPDDDVVSCGWKVVVQDIDRALS